MTSQPLPQVPPPPQSKGPGVVAVVPAHRMSDNVVLPCKGRTPQEQFLHEVKKCVDKGLQKYAAGMESRVVEKLRRLVIDKVKEKEHGNTRFHIEETPRKIFKLVSHYSAKYKTGEGR